MHYHADRVRMANIAQVVNVLQSMVLTQDDQMVRTPTWHVFKMFKVHHDATLLPVAFESPVYTHGDESIPAVTASASKDANGAIHMTVTNADPKRFQTISCRFVGVKSQTVEGQIITANEINAYNAFGEVESIFIQPFPGARIQEDQVVIQLPPKSVVMVSMR